MADLDIPLLDPDAPVECAECEWTGKWDQAGLRIDDIATLVSIADRVPAGLCPECGKLAFLNIQDGGGDHGLAYAARSLFPHFCALQSGLAKLMAEGALSADNMGEHWIWLKTTIERLEMEEHEALVAELERILDDD